MTLATIKVQGGEYATVPTRLKAFRESHPRADVKTEPTFTENGDVIFKATIVSDVSDESSPKATGHSYGKMAGAKAFEKQETIAVGRALALLGYLNNGQIASTEEMEEFESYQAEKIVKQIEEAETVEELLELFNAMDSGTKKEFTPLLGTRRKELTNVETN